MADTPQDLCAASGNSARPHALAERLARGVAKDPDSDCLLWVGGRLVSGYGKIKIGGKNISVHRAAYEIAKGPIAPELVIDHLCRNRACCNVDHLEPVTRGENVLRGVGRAAINRRRTHCVNGHPFDEANTRLHKGRRVCRQCTWTRDTIRRGGNPNREHTVKPRQSPPNQHHNGRG